MFPFNTDQEIRAFIQSLINSGWKLYGEEECIAEISPESMLTETQRNSDNKLTSLLFYVTSPADRDVLNAVYAKRGNVVDTLINVVINEIFNKR